MTTSLDQTNAEYMVKQIVKKLVGRKIVTAFQDPNGYFGFDLDDKSRVWIDRDAEGNGPGWLNIETGRR